MIDYDGLRRLAYQIKTETQKAANTALRVGTLFEDIIDALREGDNSDLINSINKINTDISKIINQIKDINNDIDQTIIKRIEAAERNITNIISNINTITGDINTINSTLSNHTTMIENINGQITAINNNLTTLSSQISNINSTISGITSDLTALTSRVTVNEADIADLRRQIINLNIDAIRESISNLESNLDDLERRVTTLEGDVIDLRTDLNAEIERAEATYAKKTDLPDMSDVFYKSKGGVVKAATTFENSLTMSEGNPITFDVNMQKATVPLMRVNSAVFSAIHPTSNRMDFGMLGTSFNFISNIPITRIGSGLTYKMWDSGNDGEGSGLDADLLDGHHWSEISSSIKGYLPLSGGTMTGTIVLPKSEIQNGGDNPVFLGLSALPGTFSRTSPISADALLYYDTTFLYLGNPGLDVDVWGHDVLIEGEYGATMSSDDLVNLNSRGELRATADQYITMYTPLVQWALNAMDKIDLLSSKTNTTFDVFDVKHDPTIRVKTKVKLKTASSGSTSYEMLHEGNSVYVVSSYPTDLSSYPDGAIFIKTS